MYVTRVELGLISVNYALPWETAVRRAAPRTPSTYAILKVGTQYPPPHVRSEAPRTILLGFPDAVESPQVLRCMTANDLRAATPQHCFAIAETRPKLAEELGRIVLGLVSLHTCTARFDSVPRVPLNWFERGEWEAYLEWMTHEWSPAYLFPATPTTR